MQTSTQEKKSFVNANGFFVFNTTHIKSVNSEQAIIKKIYS